jgi:formate dehydrogenase iron-sulfur subunit
MNSASATPSNETTATVTPPPQPAIDVARPIASTVPTPQEWLGILLKEQNDLTAVERFSKAHDDGKPAQARYYEDLIPLSKPQPGQQYGFEVDLDACTGCKACVAACHNLNGLDDDEAWRNVGLLVSPEAAPKDLPMLQMVTTACHHCAHPACLEGCPVMAYDKDPVTGIVKHLDDQCIGCQYCVLKCPYDVPKYSKKRGIVRKCDMCSSRLAVNEAPACVQACPNTAIRIKLVDVHVAKKLAADNDFLAGTPNANYTVPTTVYKTKRPELKGLVPVDQFALKPDHGHTPLVGMLTIMQLAFGLLLANAVLGLLGTAGLALAETIRPFLTVAALGTIGLGLGVAQLHLGRPLYAFRAFLGLRTSWLSREVIGFGIFAKCVAAFAATFWIAKLPLVLPAAQPYLDPILPYVPLAQKGLEPLALLMGLAATFASVMVYVDTRRPMWTMRFTAPKFFGSALIFAAAALPLALLAGGLAMGVELAADVLKPFGLAALGLTALLGSMKLGYDLSLLLHLKDADMTFERKSSLLLTRPLLPFFAARVGLALIGTVLLPLTLAVLVSVAPVPTIPALGLMLMACGAAFLGELAERHLFFRASVPLKMPGGSPV